MQSSYATMHKSKSINISNVSYFVWFIAHCIILHFFCFALCALLWLCVCVMQVNLLYGLEDPIVYAQRIETDSKGPKEMCNVHCVQYSSGLDTSQPSTTIQAIICLVVFFFSFCKCAQDTRFIQDPKRLQQQQQLLLWRRRRTDENKNKKAKICTLKWKQSVEHLNYIRLLFGDGGENDVKCIENLNFHTSFLLWNDFISSSSFLV